MRAILAQARADFLERTRRFSFLAVMALALFLAYASVPGIWAGSAFLFDMIEVEPDLFVQGGNPSWIPVTSAMGATIFLPIIGFAFLLGSVAFDEKSGVSQLVSSSTAGAFRYIFGKFISGALLLYCLLAAVICGSIVMALAQFPGHGLSPGAFLWPFLTLAATMPLCAALSALVESTRVLRGALGFGVFFVGMIFVLSLMEGAGFFLRAIDVTGHPILYDTVTRGVREMTGIENPVIMFLPGPSVDASAQPEA
ncbi:MAG: hypothetical protein FWE09_10055, partial [Treponema sp.]|nr:hypothetical protein [Treponema sp.]